MAAQLAAASTFGNFNDWFLPSFGELNLIYLAFENAFFGGQKWSSSQSDDVLAWALSLGSGSSTWYQYPKSANSGVRAIRAF